MHHVRTDTGWINLRQQISAVFTIESSIGSFQRKECTLTNENGQNSFYKVIGHEMLCDDLIATHDNRTGAEDAAVKANFRNWSGDTVHGSPRA